MATSGANFEPGRAPVPRFPRLIGGACLTGSSIADVSDDGDDFGDTLHEARAVLQSSTRQEAQPESKSPAGLYHSLNIQNHIGTT